MKHLSKLKIVWIAFLVVLVSLAFHACELTSNGKVVNTLSLTKQYDELSKYDSAIVVVKNRDGVVMDTIYRGKVDTHAEIENLVVKGWDGGEILVDLIGLNGGVQVYSIEKKFDGRTDKLDTTLIFFTTNTSLSTPVSDFPIILGDSLPLPLITITPADLKDKNLVWSSAQPDIIQVGSKSLKALKVGNAQVTVKLAVAPSISLQFQISVIANSRLPDSISITPKPISLAAGGSPVQAVIHPIPVVASAAVNYRLSDSSIATVSTTGLIQGLAKGNTTLYAISKEKPTVLDSVLITVTAPVLVESIHFSKPNLNLFVGGSAEALSVTALPALASNAADFKSLDLSVAAISGNLITGIAAGNTKVVATSKENPLKTDTLAVTVTVVLRLDSVRIKKPVATLYTGGVAGNALVQVYPITAPQQVNWTISNPAIATVTPAGQITAVAPGKVKLYASSQADSTKKDSADVTVKRDMPQVNVGPDTIVPVGINVVFLPKVTQEYGTVAQFQWDLDGNGIWEGTSDTLKAVSFSYPADSTYNAKFHIKDSEGNDTTVTRKVRATKGSIVLIQSPLNNTYTNQATIKVKWTINGAAQDSTPITLKPGANVISRSATDNPIPTTINVYLDQDAPNKPLVHGTATTTQTLPTWTWTSGGSGGNGVYRVNLETETFTSSPEFKDTSFTPAAALTEGAHTLYVQERDLAGNWSPSGSFVIQVDLTGPGKPEVHVNAPAITSERKPVWSWKSGGNGSGNYQYKLDNNDFGTGVTPTTDTSYAMTTSLTNAVHTLYVREKDAIGNWSLSGSLAITVDTIAPAAPTVTGSTATSSNPIWNWASSTGGTGDFRFKIGTDPTSAEPITKVTTFTFTSPASPNTYTLYVQERDAAGNWSSSGTFATKYDLTKPSITITQPSGNPYITTLPSVAISGTVGGQNGIAKVSYTVSGGASADAVLGTGGAWSIASVPIVEGAAIPIVITVTDNLGNTSTAPLSVQRDNTPPAAPTALIQPTTPTNVSAVVWSWGAGIGDGTNGTGLNGQYQYKLNSTGWIATTSTSVATLTLSEGTNTFSVQEQDKAGNWSASVSNTVVLDTKAPDVVSFVGTNNSFTTNRFPTWSWNPSTTNPGVGTYNLSIVGPSINTNWDLSAKTWTPTSQLDDGTYTLTVREKDMIPGVLGTTSNFTINVDGTAPLIKVDTYANGSTTILSSQNKVTITGSIADVGGSGIAYATYEVSGGATQAATAISNLGAFSISTPAMTNSAKTTVLIKTKDKAGNTEQAYSIIFNVQVPSPTLDILAPTPENGFVTSANFISIKYSVNGNTATTETITLVEPSSPDQYTSSSKTFTAQNAIGQTVSETRTYYRVHSSVRFFSATGSGNGADCLSWKSSCSFAQNNFTGMENKNIWLLSGDYDVSGVHLPRGSNYFGNLQMTSKQTSERAGVTNFITKSNVLSMGGTQLNYIHFTNTVTGAFGLDVDFTQSNDPANTPPDPPTFIKNCIFENMISGSAYRGAAITFVANSLILNITDTKFTNMQSTSDIGPTIYMNGSGEQLNLNRCTFDGTRPAKDVSSDGGSSVKFKFVDCTPTMPNVYSWGTTISCNGTTTCQN